MRFGGGGNYNNGEGSLGGFPGGANGILYGGSGGRFNGILSGYINNITSILSSRGGGVGSTATWCGGNGGRIIGEEFSNSHDVYRERNGDMQYYGVYYVIGGGIDGVELQEITRGLWRWWWVLWRWQWNKEGKWWLMW